MGKYSHLKSQLDPFEHPKEFQDRVEEAKEAYIGLANADLVRALAMVKANKKNLETEIKKCNVEIEALSQLTLDYFDAEGLNSIRTPSGLTAYIEERPNVSVDDPTQYNEYIMKRGLVGVFRVPWKTTSSIVNEGLLSGAAPPPGISLTFRREIRLRGAGGQPEGS